MLNSRRIFLHGEITDESANKCIACLLFLSMQDASKPITLDIDSPGGAVTASLAIMETMAHVSCAVATYCSGTAGGTAAAILAHGHHGLRTAVREAHVAFSPSVRPAGQDYLEAELSKFDRALIEIIAEDTNKHQIEIASLLTSYAEFDSTQAFEFRLVDSISNFPIRLAGERRFNDFLATLLLFFVASVCFRRALLPVAGSLPSRN